MIGYVVQMVKLAAIAAMVGVAVTYTASDRVALLAGLGCLATLLAFLIRG